MEWSTGKVENNLKDLIKNEILQSPDYRISYYRFMELALYHSTMGYYMKHRPKLGKLGDFFTSPHVGAVFGQAITRAFLKCVPNVNKPWSLVEMGAGDGRLIEQVCKGLLKEKIDPSLVHIYLIEVSNYHRLLQKKRLDSLPFKICWVDCIQDLPPYEFSVLYSNELIDSFPVHRVQKQEKSIGEIYVTLDSSQREFVETVGGFSSPELKSFLTRFPVKLDMEQKLEINLYAKKWITEISNWMEKGYVFTIDYGENMKELLMRKEGTLRFFSKHAMLENAYRNPGDIDITSHVNFDSLKEWGKNVGLYPISLSTQAEFLIQSGILDMLPLQVAEDPFSLNGKKRRAINQLIHPDAMGEIFKVLIQRKGQKYGN